MIEGEHPLEARLAALKLRPLPPRMQRHVGHALAADSNRFARDWPLIGAILSGAIAACVIVGTLATNPGTIMPARSAVPHAVATPNARGETALASASPRWGDELSGMESRRLP